MGEEDEDLERLEAFTYLTVPERASYLAIMRLFTRSLMTDLSGQQVAEELDLSLDTATSRLNKLVTWGNLLPSSHTVRVRSIEEYQRTRSRYQLSPLGERVQRQADELLASTDAAREISRELLGLISQGLTDLADRLDQPGGLDAGTARETVATVFAQFWTFRDEVRDFYAFLGQVLARYDLDSAEYAGFKDLLLDYIESITEEIVLLAPRIERHLDRLEPHLEGLVKMLREGGLAGAAADLGVAVQHSRGHDLADWSGLRAWFSESDGGTDGRRSEVSQLRDATMRALQSLLANAKRMIRAGGGGASRRRELLRLAAWFDAADENTATDLFTSAFGLYPARHLGLAADPEIVVAATTSWWPAPAVEVPVSLRDRGVRAARGRVSGMADRSAQREALIEQAADEQRLRSAAAAELLSAASDLGAVRLSAPAIHLLLELMAQALGAGDPAAGTAVTSNLDLSVRCELVSKPRYELTLRSATGDLTTQDIAILITRLDPADG
ncbi:TIGR02677 family protein [Actinoplanes solisilvae]|uniref:TIGR02677 family protein n=1 Tax=Actinoplanes solisilvae TaxID=2486853 RepID=UPI0013E386E7|nr:TIGR02677 family protein [Actinoplanes solisilvae]